MLILSIPSGLTLEESQKDSLLFTNAKNFYTLEDYNSATGAFEDYLREFNRGFHHLECVYISPKVTFSWALLQKM